MPARGHFTKDPDEVLDYTVDWDNRLLTGETISTSTWVIPTGITKDSDANDDTTATVWLSGGTAGTNYSLVNRITTSQGRTYDQTITIRVNER